MAPAASGDDVERPPNEMTGVVPPLEMTGQVPVTDETPPSPAAERHEPLMEKQPDMRAIGVMIKILEKGSTFFQMVMFT